MGIVILLFTVGILSLMYILRLNRIKFEFETREEIIFLQKGMLIIAMIIFISGMWLLYIPLIILSIITTFYPKEIIKFLRNFIGNI